jgi:phage FluMu protein Com
MQELGKEWVTCPVCGIPLLKHVSGTDSKYEIKCRKCKKIIQIISAGQTIKLS